MSHLIPFRRTAALAVALSLLLSIPLAAVDARKAEYAGGTLTMVKEGASGTLDLTDETAFVFDAKKKGRVSIAYASMTGLEYGQNASRRVAMAILISPWALFSKKRRHYLTIEYTDTDGKPQAAVFELGKSITRTTLAVVATRSGQELVYQDAEAEKAGKGT